MPYDRYPAVDENFLFPPEVREANGLAPEFRNQVVPLTQTQRNNLTGDDLWNGRLILNTTTNRIDRYDLSSSTWIPMTSEPAGVIKMYGGATAPEFHVLADGSVYARTGIYAALFAVYGTTYNTGGETSGQFRVPNIKGKVVVGRDAAQTEFDTLGETGGEKTHTLSTSEMPSHGHNQDPHAHTSENAGDHAHATFLGDVSVVQTSSATTSTETVREYKATPAGDNTYGAGTHAHTIDTTAATNQVSGGGNPHNNLQPYIAMNYIITL